MLWGKKQEEPKPQPKEECEYFEVDEMVAKVNRICHERRTTEYPDFESHWAAIDQSSDEISDIYWKLLEEKGVMIGIDLKTGKYGIVDRG